MSDATAANCGRTRSQFVTPVCSRRGGTRLRSLIIRAIPIHSKRWDRLYGESRCIFSPCQVRRGPTGRRTHGVGIGFVQPIRQGTMRHLPDAPGNGHGPRNTDPHHTPKGAVVTPKHNRPDTRTADQLTPKQSTRFTDQSSFPERLDPRSDRSRRGSAKANASHKTTRQASHPPTGRPGCRRFHQHKNRAAVSLPPPR